MRLEKRKFGYKAGKVNVTNLRLESWSKEETLYRVYTRELDRELCT